MTDFYYMCSRCPPASAYYLAAFVLSALWQSACLQAAENDDVVTIYTKIGLLSSGQGTGFFINRNGEIATAYHVVQDASEITIFTQNGRQTNNVRILSLAPEHDIAILQALDISQPTYLRLTSTIPDYHQDVSIIGSPRGLPNQFLRGSPSTNGFISSRQLNTENGHAIFKTDIDVIPVDITVYSGMSGAPVVLSNEGVIGLLSGSFTESRGIAWIIPAKYIAEAVAHPTDQALSAVSWPAFNLMDVGWLSLKRSYNVPFDADHIAALEVAEGLLRRLKGTWVATEATEGSFTYPTGDKCEASDEPNSQLSFAGIDNDQAALTGTFVARGIRTASFSPGYMGYNPFMEQDCLKRITGNPDVSEYNYHIEGQLTAVADDDQADTLEVTATITECSGDNCPASAYGRQRPIRLKLATPTLITYGDKKYWRQ